MISFSHFGLGALVLKLNEIIFNKPEIKASLYPLAKGGGVVDISVVMSLS